PERLMLAYSMGIFPWYSDDTPILWYSPHKRFVLFPDKVKISGSMRKILKSETFKVTCNQTFEQVIEACAQTNRKDQPGTWITADMQKAYLNLHKNDAAHSVEVWHNNTLAGGLYGVQIKNIFCGESMFSAISNASKTALIWLCQSMNYALIDCQFHTPHLESLGAEFISREEYMGYLEGIKRYPI
ncbi:MAG: leucyl/phenylalanyl-tRNA--protein transferase, partial [Pyrinomonadaceae bacterium]|nr:leucyl/phenylalanyl-tRNA--protein transferase [Sphingobacteriaceae bacterium]